MTAQSPLPGWFLQFIGVAETLGGLGLLLPGLLRIRPGLTRLAAMVLTIIMLGATVVTVTSGQTALAVIPVAEGLLLDFLAYGRWRLVPIHPVTEASTDGVGPTIPVVGKKP